MGRNQKGYDNVAADALSCVTSKLNAETVKSILDGTAMGTTERADAHDVVMAKADKEIHKPFQETAGQLANPDCHFSHLKGIVVFCKSTFLLYANTSMVMSAHVLVTVIDSFQLSLCPETAFSQSTRSPYPLPILLASSSYGHLVCV